MLLLLGGGILIPVLGIPRTCLAVSALCVASLPLLLLSVLGGRYGSGRLGT